MAHTPQNPLPSPNPPPSRSARATGSVAPPGSRLRSIGRAIVGVAGVVAAVAAVLVFVIPSADSRNQSGTATTSTAKSAADPAPGSPTGSLTGSLTDSAPGLAVGAPGTSAPAASGRLLATTPPAVGGGLVSVSGRDLLVRCPSNQSDDTSQELGYALTAPFSSLEATVSVEGTAGQDDAVGVATFIEYREQRADRRARVAVAVARQGHPARLAAPLAGATKVSLVITCSNPADSVRIAAPTLQA